MKQRQTDIHILNKIITFSAAYFNIPVTRVCFTEYSEDIPFIKIKGVSSSYLT